MNKETITNKQAISIMTLFILGESSILVSGFVAEQDLWLSIILAMIMAFVLMYIFVKLLNDFPGSNLLDIIEKCFGRIIGKIIIFLYLIYAIDLAHLVLWDFVEFIYIVGLPYTPRMVTIIFFVFLCGYIVRKGIKVIGRFAEFFLIVPFILGFIAILLSIPNMHLDNLLPILYNGYKPVIEGAYDVFIYPFGETVIFTIAFFSLKDRFSPSVIYSRSFILGGIFLLATSIATILILGVNDASIMYYPAYGAVSRINLGGTIQRIEVISAIIFLLGGFLKVSIYLLAACKGACKLFDCKDYRVIVTPICIIIISIAYVQFNNVMEFNEWIFSVWKYYAFVFMVAIPIILYIVSRIKKSKTQND